MRKHDLLRYWPSAQAVKECLARDAESASEAVALAVHQPMRFRRRAIGADSARVEDYDEHQLLNTFLEPEVPDGRVILPIVGASGAGKSHMVRWLEAQMKGLPGAEARVVLRVPKGLSLRGVLDLLLRELEGAAYEEYRKKLLQAQESLEPDQAAGLLCEMLAQALTAMHDEAKETTRTYPQDEKAQLCVALCRADFLPALLRNQFLRDHHFVTTTSGAHGVIRRLVAQFTEERAADEEDDRQHVFTMEDLRFDDVDPTQLGPAERRALERLDAHEDRRAEAVVLLNKALDDGKRRLIRLDPTITDLFNAVRGELLKDRKELVLLVEDFAVLSGLQGQLLQVMIKEAVRDGRRELCTMRTAFAYTEGYYVPATVLTRAGFEYRIAEEQGTESELLARIVRQVGAYLNAARWGQRQLEAAYQKEAPRARGLRDWIPAFSADVEPDTRSAISAFGKSQDGHELFPFNENAIHQLAREGCLKDGGTLVFNPRLVIGNILWKVLNQRGSFERGEFLATSFSGQARSPLSARIVEHIQRQARPEELDQYLRFLTYWGGCPTALPGIRGIDEQTFAVFGLDKKRLSSNIPVAPAPASASRPTSTPAPTASATSTAAMPEATVIAGMNPLEAKWQRALEDWRGGKELLQGEANRLRQWVAEALHGMIGWDWELFRPLKDAQVQSWSRYIYIPRAGGGGGEDGRGPEESMVSVCTEEELNSQVDSARVANALMAIVQFHGVHKSWDFEGAEDAAARYSAFLEPLTEPTRTFVKARYFRNVWDPLPTLVQGLLVGARALGIEGSMRDTSAVNLIGSLLADPSDEPSANYDEDDTTGWGAFTHSARQCRLTVKVEDVVVQLSWRDHLLNLLGARQGGAATVYAIDVLRLKPVLERTVEHWVIEPIQAARGTGSSEAEPVRAMAQTLRKQSAAIDSVRAHLMGWHARVSHWMGAEFDKVVVMRELEAALEAIRRAGMMVAAESKPHEQALEAFRNARVKEAFSAVAELKDEARPGAVLAVLGQGYGSAVHACDHVIALFDSLAVRIGRQLANDRADFGEAPLASAWQALASELQQSIAVVEEVKNLARH